MLMPKVNMETKLLRKCIPTHMDYENIWIIEKQIRKYLINWALKLLLHLFLSHLFKFCKEYLFWNFYETLKAFNVFCDAFT